MAKTNDSSSATAERMEGVLKTIEALEILKSMLEEKETKCAQELRVMDGKGYLCIGGKSILEIAFVPSHSA